VSVIAIVGRIQVRPEKVARFEQVFRKLQADVAANEEGCVLYRLTRSRTEPRTYRNIEVFRDQAALEAHTRAAHFLAAFAELQDCVEGEPQVEYLDGVD
jgi:quinol monooxygenase YgiN